MNTSVEGIIVNNCQYAPIYLIQDPGATQGNTYVLASSNVEPPKPVSNNLKTFYENSGNIENGLLNADTGVRPNVIKKKESILIRNNLKLASFLLPKNDNVNKQYVVDNIVLKPTIATTASTPVVPVNHLPVNTVPKIDIDRKIVKLKEVPIINRHRHEKVLPKIKPKENAPNPTQSKHTSVQLIKLGETYHSLNHLSDEQIKMVNQALKMFNDPDKSAPEPTYDPVTNTKYIYKVVSPKDLTVVAKKKILLKDRKNHTKIPKKIEDKVVKHINPEKIVKHVNAEKIVKHVNAEKIVKLSNQEKVVKHLNTEKIVKHLIPEKIVKPIIAEKIVKPVITKEVPIPREDIEEEFEPEPPAEAKVTRSGRKVKLPKQILPEGSPQKQRKKSGTIVSCFQCAADFGSLYRLQKHYENHPTHIPAKIHSNLFHCLLAIIKSGSDGNKTNIFIQQLEQLIVKIKSLLPCLLKKVDGTDGQPCTINEDIGRLFGMNPGKYNIDVEALNCVKDKNGYCVHNPPKINPIIRDQNKPSPHLLKHADVQNPENESENCARINSVAKWPTVSKRIWKLKQKTHEQSAKKMRLKSESDTLIELGTEDFLFPQEGETTTNAAGIIPENNMNTADIISEEDVDKMLETPQECNINCDPEPELQTDNNMMTEHGQPKTNYVQFHSAHFDIRSSPIKPSSTVFRKFQINPSNMSTYDAQVIRSLEMVNKASDKHVPAPDSDKNIHISLPISENNLNSQNLDNRLHVSMPNGDTRQHVTNSSKNTHVSISDSLLDTLTSSDSCQLATIPHSHNNELHLHTSMANSHNRLQVTMSDSQNRLHVDMLNSNNSLHVTKSNSNDLLDDITNLDIPNSSSSLHVTMPETDSRLHVSMPNTENGLHAPLPNSNGLHLTLPSSDENLRLIMPPSENSLDVSISNGDSLHDLFKNDVDLSCKDSDVIDPVLKDWIISTSEKSEDGFTKIAPSLLHVRDTVEKSLETHKTVNHCGDMPSLDDSSDNRLLSNQGESVLNFLDTLGNDLYPETEIRNNSVDFQLDLFAFHHS
ncbi:hypothetical protein PYW07_016196 [Mythimna separata]|uniref:C2H2-type domain-containing protein n=1 Tax=Mythimna separata TaxID=271217 RepID=A0AAD7YQP0_MYTSE|nr:hypothetical protein PYW07_016196 [Mythimna separata]